MASGLFEVATIPKLSPVELKTPLVFYSFMPECLQGKQDQSEMSK